MTSSRQLAWWLLFGVGLVVAISGWLWMTLRLVRSESEAAQARIRHAEEQLLAREAGDLLHRIEEVIAEPRTIPEIARSGVYAGFWKDSEALPEEVSAPAGTLKEWRQRLRDGNATASEIQQALAAGDLKWGWAEDGRDPVAGLLLTLHRRGDQSESMAGLLRERVWNYDPPALSPGFRLTLARSLQKLEPSPDLGRLIALESIRAAEGNPQLLDASYELITQRGNGGVIRTFWTPTQLLALLPGDGSIRALTASPPEKGSYITVPGFQQFPYLSSPESAAATDSGRAFIWISSSAGLVLIILAVTALLIGRHQLRLARQRTDLAASVAHELRTPLAGQRLLLESLLENDALSPDDRADYLQMAYRENKRLSRLGEEFLTFSRLERGVLQLENERIEIPELLEEASATLRSKLDDSDEFLLEIPREIPAIRGDREALATVLRNLLENAWKYSDTPCHLALSARDGDNEVILSVRDQGIGLSPRDQQRIFRQFYRVDRRLSRQRDGLGLGLSIVQRLVTAMDGRVEIDSQPGVGSEFRIHLPKTS